MSDLGRRRQLLPKGLRSPSLLQQFGALSLVLVVLLAGAVGWQLSSVITRRAQLNAQTNGQLMAQIAIGSILYDSSALTAGAIDPREAAFGDQLMQNPVVRRQFLSVVVRMPNGMAIYSSRRSDVGHTTPLTPASVAALKGVTSSRVEGLSSVHADRLDASLLGGDHRVLVVTMPLVLKPGAAPALLLDVALPYAATDAAVRHDTRVLFSSLAVGFLVLYCALFNLVASASARLRRQARANRQLATHDALTGLANRALLRERVAEALAHGGRRVALLLLDLDRFKEINDTLGHHHGDLLLAMVGPRLQTELPPGAVIARLGGDEFVVLLPEAGPEREVEQLAKRLFAVLTRPFEVDDVILDVGCSIGIAMTPQHGTDFETLLQHADVAMYVAKARQLGTQFYEPEQDVNTPARLALLGELRRAVEHGELVVHYQPKADARTGQVSGVEALVRWQHPQRGLLGPDAFIPLAEHTGLIRPLTHVVLGTALEQTRAWADAGRTLSVAVNVSARCLLDLDFPGQVAQALQRHGVAPDRLQLEITESSVMVDPDRSLQVLHALAEQGIRLSIDDFGTGYSSMAYLQRLPVHELKIDRSFVMEMGGANSAIVASTIDLGRNLGLHVVAEGVEDAETWQRLSALGCDSVQGYFLTRPLPAHELDAWWSVQPAVPITRAVTGAAHAA